MIEVSCAMAMSSWLSTMRRSKVVPDPIGPTMKMGLPPVDPSRASATSAPQAVTRAGREYDTQPCQGRPNRVRAAPEETTRDREGRPMPRLSIVLVTYREQCFLRRSVCSLLDHVDALDGRGSEVEVLFVDDAPP